MFFLFNTNINGLLDWEDFAQKGVIKFPDYGLILTVLVIIYLFLFRDGMNKINQNIKSSLLVLIIFHVFYYLFLFLYSVALQGSIEWPVKIGRTYLYGISIIVFYLLLVKDPQNNFRKVFVFIKIFTVLFSIMYILYNYFGINFYADSPYEIIETDKGEVTRNFAAFPYFLMYFYCIVLIDLLNRKGNLIFNFILLLLYAICMVAVLTRGIIIIAVVLLVIAYLISKYRIRNLFYILLFWGAGFFILNSLNFFNSPSYIALVNRSEEISKSGIGKTNNFEYRTEQFFTVLNSVNDFNPFFGFGFTSTESLGYHFANISAGSPDNGFTNLLGITGYIGLFLFLIIIFKWASINIKLQKLGIDNLSKANFLFIIFIFLRSISDSSMIFFESFGLFLVYDLLIYRKHLNIIKAKNTKRKGLPLIYLE